MTRCEYAGCPSTAVTAVEGWTFCQAHACLHDEEKIGGEESKARDRSGRIDRTGGPSSREIVGSLHALGLSDREIAAQAGIGRTTVRQHRGTLGLGPNSERVKVALCGTRAGRMRHRDQGEPACDACVQADRAWHRENHRRRKVAA